MVLGSAQQKIQSSQSTTEETIETWRQADEKATREAHDMVSDQCAELTEFGTKLRDQIRASDQAVSMFVEKQFKRDVRTGQTPARRNDLQFPNEFVQVCIGYKFSVILHQFHEFLHKNFFPVKFIFNFLSFFWYSQLRKNSERNVSELNLLLGTLLLTWVLKTPTMMI